MKHHEFCKNSWLLAFGVEQLKRVFAFYSKTEQKKKQIIYKSFGCAINTMHGPANALNQPAELSFISFSINHLMRCQMKALDSYSAVSRNQALLNRAAA